MSIGRNTAIGMVTDITVVLLGIVVSVVLARALGREGRGVYVFLTTTNVLLTNIAHLSVIAACSTFLARGKYRPGQVNTVALVLAVGLGVLAIAAALVAFMFFRDSVFTGIPLNYLLVALLLTPISIYQNYWNYMMMGLNRIVTLNKVNLVTNITSTLLMIIVVGFLGLGIPGFLGVWVCSNFVGLAYALVLANRIEGFSWPPEGQVARDMVGFGLRSHGANIAHYLFLRFDTYAVNTFVGKAGLGVYSLSTSLAEKLWLPLNAMQASSINKITQLPHDESALLTAKVSRTALLMIFSLAIPFAIISPWLVPFLYGPAFAPAVLPLNILFVGAIAFALMVVLNVYVLGQMERPGLLSVISWVQLGVSVPLYIVMILWQGIIGAAIASSITYLLAMSATMYIFLRDSRLSVADVLVPKAADFRDYWRIIQSILARLRPRRHPR